jgi:uncharacterized protein (TIGR01244 family)
MSPMPSRPRPSEALLAPWLAPVAGMLAASALLTSPLRAQEAVAPLETVRNFQQVSERLASSGQIGYDQVSLLREEGYDVVVNLAIADEERNAREGFFVTREGMTYIHIPVDWNEPAMHDVELFFDVMEANADRKVYVHCFANMRASAFVYMYRTLVEGVPEEEARATMDEVWDPWELEQWGGLIDRAREVYAGGR